jgi:hypothetical protein
MYILFHSYSFLFSYMYLVHNPSKLLVRSVRRIPIRQELKESKLLYNVIMSAQ